MPVYRGIKLSLISQHGPQALPEYSPSRIFHGKLTTAASPAQVPDQLPALLDSTTQTATVYIPIFPRSLYWIRYHVYVPKSHPFFYFKAFVNGVHLVSWGVGEGDGFRGKVMFGLFDNGRGSGLPCRQLLSFSDDTSLDFHSSTPPGDEALEIRVYRAKARRAIPAVLCPLPSREQNAKKGRKKDTVRFRNAFGFKAGGEVNAGHPLTQYEYALLDPVDVPYATFRWLPRTWHELDQLDVVSLDSEPSGVNDALDLLVRSNICEVDGNITPTPTEAQSRSEEHGAAPFRVAGEGSPLRVPVYQASCSALEPHRSPTRGTVAERLAFADYNVQSNVHSKGNFKDDLPVTPPRRSRVLEPYNRLDRVATAQPANRATLLDSVVSQLRSRRPSSPHAKKALQQYLERRPSERSSTGSSTGSEVSSVTHVNRTRADSYQAELECASAVEIRNLRTDTDGTVEVHTSHVKKLMKRFEKGPEAEPVRVAKVCSPRSGS